MIAIRGPACEWAVIGNLDPLFIHLKIPNYILGLLLWNICSLKSVVKFNFDKVVIDVLIIQVKSFFNLLSDWSVCSSNSCWVKMQD